MESQFAGLQLVTAPTLEPLSLNEALTYLALDSDGADGDQLVEALIQAARQYCEDTMLRSLLTQTWRVSFTDWPTSKDRRRKAARIQLPRAPLQSVTSITYRKTDGTLGTMTAANFVDGIANSYNVWTDPEPGEIVLPYGGQWPTDVLMPGPAIQITYVAGFRTLDEQPSPPTGPTWEAWAGYGAVMQAMKLLISNWHENRVPLISLNMPKNLLPTEEMLVAQRLLRRYRIEWFA